MEASLSDWILATWRTNALVTAFLIESLPDQLWPMKIPGAPRRTVRMIAGHLHNNRCMWIKAVSRGTGVSAPQKVDRYRVSKARLLPALQESSAAMLALLESAITQGGKLPKPKGWSNLPYDIVHFVTYQIAHEAHHRGQLVMLARELDHRLPESVTTGLWRWKEWTKESES